MDEVILRVVCHQCRHIMVRKALDYALPCPFCGKPVTALPTENPEARTFKY